MENEILSYSDRLLPGRTPRYTRSCRQCGAKFEVGANGARRIYCSVECAQEAKKNWHKTHPDQIMAYRLMKIHGLQYPEYRRMLKKQNGKCWICQAALDKGVGIRKGVKKLICRRCSIGLGNLNDNPKLLRRALKYYKS